MGSEINFWYILLSGVTSTLIGFFWYGPIFGKIWMKDSLNIDQTTEEGQRKMKEMQKKGATTPMIVSIFGWLITAYILSNLFSMLEITNVSEGLKIVFWLWLGFTVPMKTTTVLFSNHPRRLIFIDTGYWLVTLIFITILLTI